jgi:hypothetical protein
MISLAALFLLLFLCIQSVLSANVLSNTDPITHRSFYSSGSYAAAWDSKQIDGLPLCTSEMVPLTLTPLPQPPVYVGFCSPSSQVTYTYSKCSTDGVRFLAYYYTSPCRLGFPLPPNVAGLPCSVNCGPGSYLQPGDSSCRCRVCPPPSCLVCCATRP